MRNYVNAAQRMYEQFGFQDVAPYYHSPIAGTRFMSLDLTKNQG